MAHKRVIIADDALDFGRMLQATLATVDATLNVTVVPSAEEAMLEASRLVTDLLVTDIRLPGMSGVDLVKRIHKRNPNLKIIVVTGLKEEDLADKALAAGADRFFVKPLTIDEFITAVQELLGMQPPPQPVPVEPPAGLTVEPGKPVQPPINGSVTDLLTNLRNRLGAQVALLADERGRVAARAGDFDDPAVETRGLPVWMAALSAGEKVARPLDGGPVECVQAYRSPEIELVLAPVGAMALVIGLKPGRSGLRVALAFEEALEAQRNLLQLLSKMGAVEPAPQPVREAEVAVFPVAAVPVVAPGAAPAVDSPGAVDAVEEDLGDLEALFAKPAAKTQTVDVDAFWDQAASAGTSESGSAGALSFEQAQKLGLAPSGEN